MIATFNYKNHRGEIALRTVEVQSLDFLYNPGFGYQPGWFLSGICQDKGERRSFALSHIQFTHYEKSSGYTIPLGD